MVKTVILRGVCVAGLAVCCWGCGSKPAAPAEPVKAAPSQVQPLTEEKVLAIARQTVATNETWLDRAEFDPPKRQSNGAWYVFVARLPRTPGGDRFLVLDPSGHVTNYIRGH